MAVNLISLAVPRLTLRKLNFQILLHQMSTQRTTVRKDRLRLKQEFREKEKQWEKMADLEKLDDDEKEIYRLHKLACEEFKYSYVDPKSGYKVFTIYNHFIRGKCCGNGCRHCPFEMKAAEENIKSKRRFNSAFYVDL